MTRVAYYTPGASFSMEGDTIMFAYQVDASNSIGPRPATQEDMNKYHESFGAFMSEQAGLSNHMQQSLNEPAVKRGPGRPKKAA